MVYDLRVFMGWEEILMSSVTKRISMVKQPYGGYLNKNQFDKRNSFKKCGETFKRCKRT